MKILLEINDQKAQSLLDVLKGLSFVKIKPYNIKKETLKKDILKAVEEVNMIKSGKKNAKNAEDFLNEL